MKRIIAGAALAALVALPAAAAAPKRKASAAAKAAAAPAKPTLPIGKIVLPPLSYTIDKSGPVTGPHPKRSDVITVNYKVTLLDGSVLDSNEGKDPITFPLGQLIPAWQILIQLMRPGDAWTLYVPSEYAYGPMARDKLPANAFLTFKVELLSIGGPEAPTFKQEQ